MTILTRRLFLSGLAAAPVIVRAASFMPVSIFRWELPPQASIVDVLAEGNVGWIYRWIAPFGDGDAREAIVVEKSAIASAVRQLVGRQDFTWEVVLDVGGRPYAYGEDWKNAIPLHAGDPVLVV